MSPGKYWKSTKKFIQLHLSTPQPWKALERSVNGLWNLENIYLKMCMHNN